MERRLGVLAGSGLMPLRVANSANSSGWLGCIIRFSGFAIKEGWPNWPHFEIPIGKIEKIFTELHKEKITDVVLCGGIKRPDLKNANIDFKGIKLLTKIAFKGDDGALKVICKVIEGEGFKIRSPDEFVKDIKLPLGHIAGPDPNKNFEKSYKIGLSILNMLSPGDVGQSIAVQEGVILAIEAAEGTDSMIERAGKLKKGGCGPILIKAPKIGQDCRVDQPVIGPETVLKSYKAGFSGIACTSESVLVLDYDETLRIANKKKITLFSYSDKR